MIKIVDFSYNNKNYKINYYSSLKSLMNQEELLKLPLIAWYELLKTKDNGEPSVAVLQEVLEKKISMYDTSSEVNGFYINGGLFWLDKATRVGLAHLADCTDGDISLVLGTDVIQIKSAIAKELLAQLERYAAECYLATAKHLLAINNLQTVEELINYDYTKGYPEKLTFNV